MSTKPAKVTAQLRSSETARFQKISRLLAWSCMFLIVALPLLVPFLWTSDTAYLTRYANLPPASIQQPLALWQRIAGALLTEISVFLMCMGLWQARQCLQGFADGRLFTKEAVQYLRRFATWIMMSAVAALIVGALLSMLLSFYNAPGQRQLAIGLGSDHLLMFFFAGLVWVMAGIIREAQTIAEENQSFV